ncbi:14081_t:CDS:2 [Cetraspora pellucida]|uniref:14081_t:CDS:1 n=1 Tax=Cetraspora pellucida TaxID=1433469 RepID=A0A9N8WN71_9GLOM|nr:14081_t:CDS:2 [Cetraspora pellucida]
MNAIQAEYPTVLTPEIATLISRITFLFLILGYRINIILDYMRGTIGLKKNDD